MSFYVLTIGGLGRIGGRDAILEGIRAFRIIYGVEPTKMTVMRDMAIAILKWGADHEDKEIRFPVGTTEADISAMFPAKVFGLECSLGVAYTFSN